MFFFAFKDVFPPPAPGCAPPSADYPTAALLSLLLPRLFVRRRESPVVSFFSPPKIQRGRILTYCRPPHLSGGMTSGNPWSPLLGPFGRYLTPFSDFLPKVPRKSSFSNSPPRTLHFIKKACPLQLDGRTLVSQCRCFNPFLGRPSRFSVHGPKGTCCIRFPLTGGVTERPFQVHIPEAGIHFPLPSI